MSERSDIDRNNQGTGSAISAGAMLRQARQGQGLHIAALAAAIKVTPRKLEMLESDQFDKLPDATFTRALAQTVCRALKIDAAPVLALLPPVGGNILSQAAGGGLNAPFRDRPGRTTPNEWAFLGNPAVWLAALLVIGAVVVYLLPARWLPFANKGGERAAIETSAAPTTAASSVSETIVATPVAATAAPTTAVAADAASAPAATDGGAPADVAAAAVSGVLQVRPTAQSWVEITDARGQALISRLVEPGETVGLDGKPPFRLRIGNANSVQLTYQGQPVELAAHIKRDNVARFELK